MNTKLTKGSCLCGTVTYQYSGDGKVFQYCHCSRCRKFTGSAHASNIIIDPNNFQWLSGEDNIGRYEVPKTNHFATSFCQKCGSSLPWKTQKNQSVVIPAGTLDDDPGIRPKHNIFYKNKASWYVNAGELKPYDELPTKKTKQG